MKQAETQMELTQIERFLPHRRPFLLVDTLIELVPGRRAAGLKKVSHDGGLLLPAYKGLPVMPGALLLEAMAQVGAVAVLSLPENQGKTTLLAGIEKACFYREAILGEEVLLEAEIMKMKQKAGRRRCRALVEGTVIAEADLLFVLVESGKGKG